MKIARIPAALPVLPVILFFSGGVLIGLVSAAVHMNGFGFGAALAADVLLSAVIAVLLTVYIKRISAGMLSELRFMIESGGTYTITENTSHLPSFLVSGLNEIGGSLQRTNRVASAMEDTHEALHERVDRSESKADDYYRRFMNSGHASIVFDRSGEILDVNIRACTLFGYIRSDFIGRSYWSLYPDKELTSPHDTLLINDRPDEITYEARMVDKYDKSIPVEINTSIVDEYLGVYQSIVTDITLRKEMQEALEQSEEKFRSFIETASDLMFITDASGRLIYCNPVMQYTTGYTIDELRSMHLSALMEIDREQPFSEAYHDLIEDEDKPRDCQWHDKDGKTIYGELNGCGIYNDSNQFLGFRGILRDVTYRKRLEESQRLVQLGKLSADVAHDIKNQLTVLYSISEISLMEGTTKEELAGNMQMIQEECQRINDVVRRLLQFSRPSQKTQEILDIHSVIDFVLKLLEKLFYQEDITLVKEFGDDVPGVRIDKTQMREVFMNLFQNAVEATPGSGTLTVKTGFEEGFVMVRIIDTGEGIPEEIITRIFDPFFTTKEKGTGLGVSACYGIITAHGGDLVYTSSPGEGTTVTVSLPPAQTAAAP
ncbi:PAS domain S-box protein [bacterium]|nr:PAS domain S-box protein [bacterium]